MTKKQPTPKLALRVESMRLLTAAVGGQRPVTATCQTTTCSLTCGPSTHPTC